MKMKSYLVLLMLVTVIFVSGCNGDDDKSFTPSIDIKLNKNSISVKDNSISSDFVTITIKRADNEDVFTDFIIKFNQTDSVYAVNVDGKRLSQLSTRSLKDKGSADTLQFKVFGKKGDALDARYSITIETWWNNTKLEGIDRTLEVFVE